MASKNKSEKVIGHCDKCRARLRVGAGTDPDNYPAAAASKRWTYNLNPTEGWAHVICAKCNAKNLASNQGTLL